LLLEFYYAVEYNVISKSKDANECMWVLEFKYGGINMYNRNVKLNYLNTGYSFHKENCIF